MVPSLTAVGEDLASEANEAPASNLSQDEEGLQSRRIQETASEILRLKLEQSQQRKLEAHLRSSTEKLKRLPSQEVRQLSSYLEQVLQPGSSGSSASSSGVCSESLCGLMECLCVVCGSQTRSREPEELLAAAQELLQSPQVLIEQLATLPAASSAVSKRLVNFLLFCESSWRGPLGEAGHCYETLRSWLSDYYQFSLASGVMESTSQQLLRQQKLLEELTKGTDSYTWERCLSRSSAWRPHGGVNRSSSVQSNSSAGSNHRSHSPVVATHVATDPRCPGSAAAAGGTGATTGPATARGRLSCGRARGETSTASPPKTVRPAAKAQGANSTVAASGAVGSAAPPPRTVLLTAIPARSTSPMQPRSPQVPRSTVAGSAPSSARSPVRQLASLSGLGSSPTPRQTGSAGAERHLAPLSPIEPAKPALARRQSPSVIRARRTPSREARGASPPPAAVPRSQGSPRVVANPAPRGPSVELSRSRSLQSIGGPQPRAEASTATPQLGTRELRPEWHRQHSTSQERQNPQGISQWRGPTPARAHLPADDAKPRAAQALAVRVSPLPAQTRPALTARVQRLPTGLSSVGLTKIQQQALHQPPLSSARRLSSPEQRPSQDPHGVLRTADGMTTSLSTPSLDIHKVAAGQPLSARSRPAA